MDDTGTPAQAGVPFFVARLVGPTFRVGPKHKATVILACARMTRCWFTGDATCCCLFAGHLTPEFDPVGR
jgi:hypothetical protein